MAGAGGGGGAGRHDSDPSYAGHPTRVTILYVFLSHLLNFSKFKKSGSLRTDWSLEKGSHSALLAGHLILSSMSGLHS